MLTYFANKLMRELVVRPRTDGQAILRTDYTDSESRQRKFYATQENIVY